MKSSAIFRSFPKAPKNEIITTVKAIFIIFKALGVCLVLVSAKLKKLTTGNWKNILLLRSQNIMIVIYWVLPYFPETFNFMTKIVINIDFVGIYEKLNLITSNKLSKIWIKSVQSNISTLYLNEWRLNTIYKIIWPKKFRRSLCKIFF